MARRIQAVVAILLIALLAGCSGSGTEDETGLTAANDLAIVEGSPVSVPASLDDLPNLDDYDVVVEDDDGWLLLLNTIYSHNGVTEFNGDIWWGPMYSDHSYPAIAIYNHDDEILTFMANFDDDYYNHAGICYALNFSGDITMDGAWMWTEDGHGYMIDADLIHGALGSHSAGPLPNSWSPREAVEKKSRPKQR